MVKITFFIGLKQIWVRNASHRATNRSARVFWKGLRGCEPRYFFQRRFFGFWFEMRILRSGSRFQIRVSPVVISFIRARFKCLQRVSACVSECLQQYLTPSRFPARNFGFEFQNVKSRISNSNWLTLILDVERWSRQMLRPPIPSYSTVIHCS